MPNLEDPLHQYNGLSHFPQTLASLPNPPSDPHDLRSSLHSLISLPVRDPDKLMEQAKSILEEPRSKVPNDTVMANDEAPQDENGVVAEKVLEERPRRERRPGLDRKRRKFSLQPNLSLSAINLEPTLDIDKLNDPEEFFKAFERLRNAQKEIAKQTGHYHPELDPNQAALKRSRRQGIPGRSRNIKYKHLYPMLSSQEIAEEGFVEPSQQTQPDKRIQEQAANSDDALLEEMETENVASQQIETDNDAHEEMEVEGSVVRAENGIGKLLEELLSHDYGELDGDGATTLLQDRLQIKPLDIEKLNLPEMQEIQRIDLVSAGESLQKPRNVLSDIHNLLKVTRSMKQQKLQNSASSLGSPTPPKSPFASLSLLKRRILQSSSQIDPFSAVDIDEPILTNASSSIKMKKNTSGKSKCLVIEDDHNAAYNSSSPSPTAGNITNTSDKSENHNVTNLGSGNEVPPSDSCAGLEEDNPGQNDKEENLQNNGPSKSVDMFDDVLHEIAPSPQPHADMDDSALEKLDEISNPCDKLRDAAIENHAVNGRPENQVDASEEIQDAALEQPNEKNEESSVASIHEQTKAKPHASRKRKGKVLDKRQSLAAAGTSWDAGLRRSTRVKSRPLEYWRGEKFLYGRVHSSLPTIIGIKCESPGDVKGKGVMKVKSFVSDEYKDLIELAAL